MDVQNVNRIYFIGIGGIGMSALARYYHSKNATVSGYDKTPSALTLQMEDSGIRIHYEDNVALLDKNAQLVVYTPAVPKDHSELNYYLHNNYTVIKRSALLGEITKPAFNICIAGTHGKTTISTLVAHILRDSGFGCNAFLGGISVNYNTNFWSSNNNVSVAEADEYDRSFLQLSPNLAVISAMDADHLDIYGTKENMEDAFVQFAERLRAKGTIFINYNLPDNKFSSVHHKRYSRSNDKADVFAENIQLSGGGYTFDIMSNDWSIENVQLNMGGLHNIENAVAAISIAHELNIDPEKIKKAVSSFKGVKRRFEYIIAPSGSDKVVFIDDYAHHPQELEALISGAKNLFPEKKCTVIFQPHLFSRTRDLADDFAKALSLADEVVLLPVYPARELPVPGVSSRMIAEKMNDKPVTVCTKDEFLRNINDKKNSIELLITAGAGDIDQLVLPVKEILMSK
ncbi:MAG TPA: UDP-N-acetylmuramate--L-alanine ligase [Chitinophagaceae bacterium]|nr:UDP-N-acetylmuramate--L-alanine ligase [Chitinophagaceae bacterium]